MAERDRRFPYFEESSIGLPFFAASCAFCFAVRVALASRWPNFDFESYQLVASLMQQGKNVYAHTSRYNYSPLWMWILYFLKSLSGDHFRSALSGFVSLVDVLIAVLLYRRGNRIASLLILFSPMCIIISGYHNQFDNLAILWALLAVRYAESRKNFAEGGLKNLNTPQIICFALLLGGSILTKHILIFFPFWFLYQNGLSRRHKFLLLFVPLAIFLLSFTPYLDAKPAIVANVFGYSSLKNLPFYRLFFPYAFFNLVLRANEAVFKYIFFALVLGSGFFLRRRPLIELLAFYCLFIVMFSTAVTTQYLVIPMLFLAYFRNRFWILYNVAGLLFYACRWESLHLFNFPAMNRTNAGFCLMIFILTVAFIDVRWPALMSLCFFKRLKLLYTRIMEFRL